MGTPKKYEPCLAFVAGFSADPAALDWLDQRLASQWSPIAMRSRRLAFDQTTYYQSDMGDGLLKQLWILDGFFDPAELPRYKNESNDWETEYSTQSSQTVSRPLNIDPGYLSLTKLVLASTKNRLHRLYLSDGIYAEISLKFIKDNWEAWPWTYEDYRTSPYIQFCNQAREELKRMLREA
jgi:hypothetical protein